MSVYAASIDDNDSQVLYSDGWVLVTQDGDWTGTMHSTSVIGSTARVRFTVYNSPPYLTRRFPCSSGLHDPTGDGQLSKASFALDNGSAAQVSHVTTPAVQWQYVFWDSGPLAFGSHLLVITNTGNEDYFRLDHIDYDPTSASSPSSSGGSGAKTTTVQSTLTSTVVVGASPSNTGNSAAQVATSKTSQTGSESSTASQIASLSSIYGSGTSSASTTGTSSGSTIDAAASAAAGTSSNKSSSPTAGIVAGILGGLLGIVLLVLAILYFRRRRRARAIHLNDGDGPSMPCRSDNTTVTPFSLNAAPSEMSSSNPLSNPSIASPYGSSSFEITSSQMNTTGTSMYTSGLDSTLMSGHYGQQQFQQFGAAGAGTGAWGNGLGAAGSGSRSKRAEFMAEQRDQLVDSGVSPAAGDYGRGNGTEVVEDQDAPPAYPGRV